MPDIASLSMVMAQNRLQNDIGTAVMAKALENFEDTGAEMTKMMELSVNPDVGANFDMAV
ncbi:MAG: YjfB family protein [Lachnospiraceae bacterium]|nr:YjfB family protein [Lachnospiraceae bacterium]